MHVEEWQETDEEAKSQQPDDASGQLVLSPTGAPWDGIHHGFDFVLQGRFQAYL